MKNQPQASQIPSGTGLKRRSSGANAIRLDDVLCASARPRDTLSAREGHQGARRNEHNETFRRKKRANAQATGGPRGELAKYRSQKTAAGDETMSELTIV